MRTAESDGTDAASPGRATVIGLTGAVAAGKSTVARAFAAGRCTVIDVDGLGHRALERPEIVRIVAEEFGGGMLHDDGSVNRSALGRLAFQNPSVLERLQELVHPLVRQWIAEEITAASERGDRAVVIDAALLFEGGLDTLCDETVCVHAPEESRLEWALAARGWDAEEVGRRAALQLSADDKRARSRRVLLNQGAASELEAAAQKLLDEIAPRGETDGREDR